MAPEGQGKLGPAVKGSTLTADRINDLADQGQRCQEVPMKAVVGRLGQGRCRLRPDPEVEVENQRFLSS